MLDRTWDGLPISREPPYGASIVVWRRAAGGGREFLILHRAHRGPEYDGDWAWTPPSGARLPGESPDECARRELHEEAGLELDCRRVAVDREDWSAYVAEAPGDAAVVLDAEHDAFAWLSADEAAGRCLPAIVAETLQAVARLG